MESAMGRSLFFITITSLPLFLLQADVAPDFTFTRQDAGYEKYRVKAGASSTLVEKRKSRSFYAAHRAADMKMSTAWCAGKKGGIGETLDLRVTPTATQALHIFNGYGATRRLYYANNRIKDVEIVLTLRNGRQRKIRARLNGHMCNRPRFRCEFDSDEETRKCEQEEKRSRHLCAFQAGGGRVGVEMNQVVRFKPACVTRVRVKILSVYRGRKYNDTCIAETALMSDSRTGRPRPIPSSVYNSCR